MPGRAPKKKIVTVKSSKEKESLAALFLNDHAPTWMDYEKMAAFLSAQGRILSRMHTGLSAKQQRSLSTAIKHARHLGLLPFSVAE